MDEKDLSEKQRKWLEASRKIGPGAMTKSERQLLEKLYAEMLPKEQQELAQYIEHTFAKKEVETKAETETPQEADPITEMEQKEWKPPSDALRAALAKIRKSGPRHR